MKQQAFCDLDALLVQSVGHVAGEVYIPKFDDQKLTIIRNRSTTQSSLVASFGRISRALGVFLVR